MPLTLLFLGLGLVAARKDLARGRKKGFAIFCCTAVVSLVLVAVGLLQLY